MGILLCQCQYSVAEANVPQPFQDIDPKHAMLFTVSCNYRPRPKSRFQHRPLEIFPTKCITSAHVLMS